MNTAKERSGPSGKRKIELKKIVPVEMLQKELETESSGIMTH